MLCERLLWKKTQTTQWNTYLPLTQMINNLYLEYKNGFKTLNKKAAKQARHGGMHYNTKAKQKRNQNKERKTGKILKRNLTKLQQIYKGNKPFKRYSVSEEITGMGGISE